MNKNYLIQKMVALAIVIIGLLAMLVAWQLLLVSGIHNTTVLVLEIGGVAVCMAGYFLWRRVRVAEAQTKEKILAVQSADGESRQE